MTSLSEVLFQRFTDVGEEERDRAKRDLGERGPVWWTDGSPDLNRRMARTTVYADWLITVS